ncbi:MAG: pentapeptide repeat-containing protein [Rhizonema sp. NSF051]|nr:pentapeptide repeat-containing protein [Rhizonema sp. NSF051]
MIQDYSGQNLRGRSFKGQDLTWSNFSYADIRGADFTGANLRNANFSNAIAGLQRHWAIFLVLVSWVLMVLSGFLSAFAGVLMVSLVFDTKKDYISYPFSGWTVVIILIIFFFFTIRQGIQAGIVSIAGTVVFAVPVAVVGAFTKLFNGAYAIVGAGAFALVIAGIVAGCVAGASALVVGAYAYAFAVPFTVAGACAYAFAFPGAFDKLFDFILPISVTNASAIIIAIAVALFNIYISWRALKGDPKFTLIYTVAIAFAAIGGTSFRSSDLTDADFTRSSLKSTDFRKANLTRTSFYKTEKLDCVRPGSSYLQQAEVRNCLRTGLGQDKNFDRLDLSGVNFKGANLVDASLIRANLNEANLQDADLSRAKLVQTQLDGTDLTGATLTGAYIQDWNITSDTKFDEVRCEYIYMRLPTRENPDPLRKPDNNKEVFAPGDFGAFIKPIVDTLDLYHNQGVDPRAIAIAFKELTKNHPEAKLEFVAMEKRGQDKFLLRALTAQQTDKSELSAEYFNTYNQLLGLNPEQQVQVLLAEKKVQENQVTRLESMIATALVRPDFYAETYNNQGNTMSDNTENSIYNLNHAKFGGGFAGDGGTQIGGVFNDYSSTDAATTNTHVKTILILAANPKTTSSLRLDEEVREIDAGLQRAKKRELFDIKQRWAVRVQDIYQALLDFKPQFVHFSGHNSGDDGLVLEDETGNVQLVETVALASLFKLFATDIECVVLNACYSEVQASALAQHIPYVIGMNKTIGDRAAIKFATGFYSALSSGECVEFAYKLGCNVIQLDGIAEHLTPVLKKK